MQGFPSKLKSFFALLLFLVLIVLSVIRRSSIYQVTYGIQVSESCPPCSGEVFHEEAVQTSSCRSAVKRGPSQKVVSFSLFREKLIQDEERKTVNNTRLLQFIQGVAENAALLPIFYPNWTMRVYHNFDRESVRANGFCDIRCRHNHIDFCDVTELSEEDFGLPSTLDGEVWRFLPVLDDNVDVFVSRDLDSRFSEREATAVQQWLRSNKTFHIMRDHPQHVATILGESYKLN